MRLSILGGGGFRVPLVVGAVAAARDRVDIDDVVLHDTDPDRLAVISAVVAEQLEGMPDAPSVSTSTDLGTAVTGAAVVFSAIRVGGTAGRVQDERVATELGLLGQETVGPGGLAYALRTVPVVDTIARTIAALAPQAWVVNFTNPAGLVTEAMRSHLGDRVIGICDTPIGLLRSAGRALDLPEHEVTGDYLGLNHLGWLRSVEHDGVDHLPRLLADPSRLARLDEAALYDIAWLQVVGALPGEYLHYYDAAHAPGHSGAAAPSRGGYLHAQQTAFFDAGPGPGAASRWRAVLLEREATYMADARAESGRGEPEAARVGGGYHEVAVDLMAALLGGAPGRMILNIADGDVLTELPPDAVIEVSAVVDHHGARAHGRPRPLTGHQRGLVASVKASERLAIQAARTGSRELAWQALADHPLVRSPELGAALLAGYLAAWPGLLQVPPESEGPGATEGDDAHR